MIRKLPALLLAAAALSLATVAHGEPLTRAEVLRIAAGYCNFHWDATDKNVMHGRDTEGVDVQTPNNQNPATAPDPALWTAGTSNTGVPYKWGGFDTIATFQAGIRAGKAAGDVYTPDKRKLGGGAVSSHAVGIDCSGFISRCWKLAKKQSTESLPSICITLHSTADLKPGDIMDAAGGHVILFARWLDDAKTSAQFFESSPYSKVISSTRSIDELAAYGYRPLRYKGIVD
jgi:hypothetical protein